MLVEQLVQEIVFSLIRLVGKAVVQEKVNEWDEVKEAARLAAVATFGPRPPP